MAITKLKLGGVTVQSSNVKDIARFKGLGYQDVKDIAAEEAASEKAAEKAAAEKAAAKKAEKAAKKEK